MKLSEIKELIGAKVLCGEQNLDIDLDKVFACDFMSDILAYANGEQILLTGMLNQQVIRTAEMVDMKCVIFVRGKCPEDDVIELAKNDGLVLMATSALMYDVCGILYSNGLGKEA